MTTSSTLPARRLELSGLSVRFGGLAALSDVSFDLRQGQIHGLIGPNGAGKTTLVNCISGYQRPSGGRVRLDGVDTGGWSAQKLRRAGVARTFQSGRLFNGMTVEQNVEVCLLGMGQSRRQAAPQVREMLELLELAPDARKLAGSLAYTAARILSMARALANAPAFVLLDEPAAGMSEPECHQLARFIQGLPQRFGCGVLLIEHNMSLIDAVCESVHVLDGGRHLVSGTPLEIRGNGQVIEAYLGTSPASSTGTSSRISVREPAAC